MLGTWQGIGMGGIGALWQPPGKPLVGDGKERGVEEPALWEKTQDLQTENSETSSIQGL